MRDGLALGQEGPSLRDGLALGQEGLSLWDGLALGQEGLSLRDGLALEREGCRHGTALRSSGAEMVTPLRRAHQGEEKALAGRVRRQV
jgi:hypothetical protein